MRFNKFVGKLSLVLFITLIVSLTVFSLYSKHLSKRSNQSLYDLFDLSGNQYTDFNSEYNLDDTNSFNNNIVESSQTFEALENINISCSTEDVIFIHEERDTILVEYYHEKPDLNSYKLTYDLSSDEDTIYISSSLSMNSFQNFSRYKKSITIHVPMNYKCNYYEINKSIGTITTDSFPKNVSNISINADASDTKIDITSSIDKFLFDGNAGSIDITTHSDINQMIISCDLGNITLSTHRPIDSINMDTNAGSVDITAHESINSIKINSDLGSIESTFYKKVNDLAADVNAGDINLTFHENDDSTVYANVNLGSIDSDLPLVQKSSSPDFIFNSNLGAITVTSY